MKRNFWTHIKQHHQLNVNPESLFSGPFIVHIQIGIYTYIRYTNIVENDWQMVETVRRKPFFALFPSFFLPTVWRMDNKTHLIYISNGFRMNQIPNSVECIDGIFIFPISTSEMMNVWVCECECECDCDGFCVCVWASKSEWECVHSHHEANHGLVEASVFYAPLAISVCCCWRVFIAKREKAE